METILLFGGESDERLVSVASAQAMAESLPDIALWFWHEQGSIFSLSLKELLDHKDPFNQPLRPKSAPLFKDIKEAIGSKNSATFILALHGGAGENGQVQALLENQSLFYTGSDSYASDMAFDKLKTKLALMGTDIKLAPHIVIKANEYDGLEKKLNDFFVEHQGFILKPIAGGSSLGCIFARDQKEIACAIEELKAFKNRDFLAEKLIMGRELTVGVIEDSTGLTALTATEIIIDQNRQFDYQGKYLGLGTKEITPADINQEVLKEAQRISLLAHKTLNLYGYSRTDLILNKDGFYFLEINTLPGLTKSSLVPQQLEEAGISMGDFLAQQIRLANTRE
jgi:D-alanine-D-alanine ligase